MPMIKIWVKTVLDNKIKKSIVFENYVLFNRENFENTINLVCQKLDEPAPVILTKHFNHFSNFNITEFKKSDFVESVSFDEMIIENALTD